MTTVIVEHRFRHRFPELFECRAGEILVAGPAGTGKSRACMEKLHCLMLMHPGARGLIVRKAATTLSSTALVTWQRFVAAEHIAAGEVRFFGGSTKEPASYQYKNGSVVTVGGLDKASKIMSSEYDVIYVQEATELSEDDWETLTTRLRNSVSELQQLIADCNPQNPDHWLKRRCDAGKTVLLDSVHENNPTLFSWDSLERRYIPTQRGTDYMAKLDSLTGVRYKRLRLGKWVAAEGVIYEEWNSTIHLIDRPDTDDRAIDQAGIPLAWPRYWSVDFGYTNPFVCQMWAEDPDGRLYLYREIYYTQRTVDQHARIVLGTVTNSRGSWTEPKPRAILADTDAEGRATLEREIGRSTEPAHKSVLEGIEAVQVAMRVKGDGRPGLFILRGALHETDPLLVEAKKPTCTVEEIPAYVWSDSKTKEAPTKEDDHGCDAMRYLVANRAFGIRAIYRSIVA